jgi:hypothetical protein
MPWVPRDLYDEMLAALKDRRAPVVVPAPAAPAPHEAAAFTLPLPLMLSPAVYDACVRFAFGDPNEKAANLRLAKMLMRDGIPDREILDAVKHGAAPVTL